MRWFLQASASDCLNPRLYCLLLCIFPIPSRFPNTRHSHHTGSSAHLGFPCLRPSISDCHTRSFSHLGVARLRPIIMITHPDFLSHPVEFLLHSHIPTAHPPPLGSRESSRVARSCFFRRLLAPPCLPPPFPSFVHRLPFTHLK